MSFSHSTSLTISKKNVDIWWQRWWNMTIRYIEGFFFDIMINITDRQTSFTEKCNRCRDAAKWNQHQHHNFDIIPDMKWQTQRIFEYQAQYQMVFLPVLFCKGCSMVSELQLLHWSASISGCKAPRKAAAHVSHSVGTASVSVKLQKNCFASEVRAAAWG
jgi:hypothetical protein